MRFSLEYKVNDELFVTSLSDDNVVIIDESNGSQVLIKVKPLKKIQLVKCTLEEPHYYRAEDYIFVNGYQSWTDTKEFTKKNKLRNVKKLPKKLVNAYAFDQYGDAFFKEYKKHVLHGYDVSYIKSDKGLFIYSNNYKNAYLIINHDVKKKKIVLESDVASRMIDSEFTLFDFIYETTSSVAQSINQYMGKQKKVEPIFGYTSWYNHYQNINEEKILFSLDNIDKRFNLFQIDDGYETFVGDWLKIDKNKFPHGLDNIIDEIHSKGMKAGIWLAPFAAETNSETFKNHPDWFLKNDKGEFIKCGSNWSGFYALDFYNEEARAYIKECLEYYMDLGFDFFKLDFLYAICVKVPANKTRAEVSYEAYSFLREVLKDKLILGCGANISSSYNNFDYLRIGPDVSLIFDDVFYMRFMHRERISTKVTIQNTIYRSFLNGRVFGNDPDVFLLRDDNVKMNFQQRKALIIMNALFGSVMMTSDDIFEYNDEKKDALNLALLIKQDGQVVSYCTRGKYIDIVYKIKDKNYELSYDTKKGILL